jgi:hypothetical protein
MQVIQNFIHRRFVRPSTLTACLMLCVSPLLAQHSTGDPDEGTFSSIKPRIPEPMVFDLIRPLGAERGEFEVNSLFRFQPGNSPRRLLWAPEVEYAFLEGYGIEFEVPMENGAVESWKGAIQGTLPGPWKKTFIHGWQALGETSHSEDYWKLDLLYLAGSRWHRRWSAFTMTGLERESQGGASGYAYLGNYTLNFHQSKYVTYGLENNIKGRGLTGRRYVAMPQVQLRRSRVNVQLGTGYQFQRQASGVQLAWRISREF